MSALLEHILRRDVSKLRAYEVSECLFYLDRLSKPTAGNQENIAVFRRKLHDRLSELREARNSDQPS